MALPLQRTPQWQGKHAQVRELLSEVEAGLRAERIAIEEQQRLEDENASLRRELEALIHDKQQQQPAASLSASSARFGEQELSLLRTQAYLATCTALLRQQLQTHWSEQRQQSVALAYQNQTSGGGSGAAIASAAAAAAASAGQPVPSVPMDPRDQQTEISWILQTLPQPPPQQPAGAATPLPTLDSPSTGLHVAEPLSPTRAVIAEPLPVVPVSHSPPFGSLSFPLDRLSGEWSALFPVSALASARAGAVASEFERVEWEGLLEELWDGVQVNRALFDEFAPPAAKTAAHANAATAAVVTDSSIGSSDIDGVASSDLGGQDAQGDAVVACAMENFGFVTDSTLRATMLGAADTLSSSSTLPPSTPLETALPFPYPSSERHEFDEADSPSNIVLEDGSSGGGGNGAAGGGGGGSDGPRAIKAATLHKLVERVTSEHCVDLSARYVFLLTHHSFCSSTEVLRLLCARFFVPLPAALSPEELSAFRGGRLERIQIRVCSVLKSWIDEHWQADFADSPPLQQALRHVLHAMRRSAISALARQLAGALDRLVTKKQRYTPTVGAAAALDAANTGGGADSADGSSSSSASGTHAATPKPLVSSRLTLASLSELHFLSGELDPLELARQLTLLDFAQFRLIAPRECLNQNWSRAQRLTLAPHIVAMIARFNALALWCSALVVLAGSERRRTAAFAKCLKLAAACLELRNFHAAFALYCGLSANPVHRLRRTKAGLSARAQGRLAQLAELFRGERNSRAFRRALQAASPPALPHLGLLLSDLTFTEDGNPDTLQAAAPAGSTPSTGGSGGGATGGPVLINFQKRCKLAERIRFLRQFQQQPYALQPQPVLQAWISEQLAQPRDAEQLWKISKEVEPKEQTR